MADRLKHGSTVPDRTEESTQGGANVRLILLTVAVAAILGLSFGGSLQGFPAVRLRWWWLAIAGLALQLLPLSGTWATAALLASFAGMLAFAVANLSAPGFVLILIGLALNALVIGANQGMPVTRHALIASGQSATLDDLVANGGAKHHLADGGTIMLPLGDVIAIPPPIAQAISVGDICVQLGAAWFVIGAMPRRARRTAEVTA